MKTIMSSITLLNTVNVFFLSFLLIQFIGLIINIVAISKSEIRELSIIFKKFWDKAYINENLLGISLWITSIISYIYLKRLLLNTIDVPIIIVIKSHPVVFIQICIVTILLFLYSIYRTTESINNTKKIVGKLKWSRRGRNLMKVVDWISLIFFRKKIGKILYASNKLLQFSLEKAIGSKVRKSVKSFFFIAIIEYYVRMSVIIYSLFCVTT